MDLGPLPHSAKPKKTSGLRRLIQKNPERKKDILRMWELLSDSGNMSEEEKLEMIQDGIESVESFDFEDED